MAGLNCQGVRYRIDRLCLSVLMVAAIFGNPMQIQPIALALVLSLLMPALANAGTDCRTRQSGTVTITSCSDSGSRQRFPAMPQLSLRQRD